MRPDCLPIHVSEVPDYEVRGDCIVVMWRGLELFVPIPICLAAMGRCEEALAKWKLAGLDNGSVVRFSKHR